MESTRNADHRNCAAVLADGGRERLAGGKILRPNASTTDDLSTFHVTAQSLAPGKYLLTLRGENRRGQYKTVQTYAFHIVEQETVLLLPPSLLASRWGGSRPFRDNVG